MATIQNKITLQDGMSSVLNNIINKMTFLNNKTKQASNSINIFSSNIRKTTPNITSFSSSINKSAIESSALKSDINSLNTAYLNVNKNVSALVIKNNAVNESFKKNTATSTTLKNSLTQLGNKFDALSHKVQNADTKLNGFRNNINVLNANTRTLTSALSLVNSSINIFSNSSNRIGTALVRVNASIGTFNTSISIITRNLNAFNTAISRANETVSRFGNSISRISTYLNTLDLNIARNNASVRTFVNSTAGASSSTINLNASLSRINLALNALNSYITTARNNMTSLSGAMLNVSSASTGLNSSISTINTNVNNIGATSTTTAPLVSNLFGQVTLANVAANYIVNLTNKIMELPGEIIKASDAFSMMQAKFNILGKQEGVPGEQITDQVYKSALRSRTALGDVGKAVAKLGLTTEGVFSDTGQIVRFMETINKAFSLTGTSTAEKSGAILQLTQGLGSGVLQGDELRSVRENAPMAAKAIADYMGTTVGGLKELGSQGYITADIVVKAILGATEQIEKQFSNLPFTWEQNMTNLSSVATMSFKQVFDQISAIANSPIMTTFFNAIAVGMQVSSIIIAGVINELRWLGGIAYEVGSYLGEWLGAGFVILGTAAEAVLPYVIGLLITFALAWAAVNIQAGISAIASGIAAAQNAILAGSIWLVTWAQAALNLVLSLNPIPIIIGLVLVVIGMFAGWSIATKGLRNVIAGAFGSMVDIVQSSVNTMIGLVNGLIGILNKAASGINNVFGTNIGAVSLLGTVDYGDKKQAVMDYIQNFSMKNITDAMSGFGLPDIKDKYGGVYDVPGMSPIADKVKPVKVKGGKLDKDQEIQISEENLRILTDLAKREVVLNYQQITPQFNVTFGDVRETADVDTVMDRIERRMIDIYEGNLGVVTT